MCDMIKPSFIPPPDIRHLRDFLRFRMKMTYQITGMKNRTLNCLTVSNLKLMMCFQTYFVNPHVPLFSRFLIIPVKLLMLRHLFINVANILLKKFRLPLNGAVCLEQAKKLKICLDFIDEQEKCISELDKEIFRLAEPYSSVLAFMRTVPGLSKEPLTAIRILSEIGSDMSVFRTSKHLVSQAGCCPRNDSSAQKVKSTRISCAGSYLKPLLVQIANALLKSKEHPEFKERYRRIKARRGHKKAIVALCRMLLTAIWNVLSKCESYSAKGYLADKLTEHSIVISKSEGLALLRKHGYIFKDEVADFRTCSHRKNMV